MRYRHIISVRTIIDTKNVLHKKGGGGLWVVYSFHFFYKDNYVYDHFISLQLILQLSLPLFPSDNMHNVQ